jgi:hypothetical protein
VELKALFQQQARAERYEISKAMLYCKMEEGTSVSQHILKLAGYWQRLEALGFAIPATLGTDLVLSSLPLSYNGFIMNYDMNGMDKSVNELFNMLRTAEIGILKNANHVMMVNKMTSFKKKGKAKKKGKSKGTGETEEVGKPKGGATSETECFFCMQKGQ